MSSNILCTYDSIDIRKKQRACYFNILFFSFSTDMLAIIMLFISESIRKSEKCKKKKKGGICADTLKYQLKVPTGVWMLRNMKHYPEANKLLSGIHRLFKGVQEINKMCTLRRQTCFQTVLNNY